MMSDNINSLVLEQLRLIRAQQERIWEEIREIKTTMLSMKHELRGLQLNIDALGEGVENVKKRVDRIERRLELNDGTAAQSGLAEDQAPFEPRPPKRG
jgi:predicted  nucleic acid-binding Zn-ribbon protein